MWISILYFLVWLLVVLLILLFLLLFLPINIEIKNDGEEYKVKIKLWFLDFEWLKSIFSKLPKKEKESKKSNERKTQLKAVLKYSKLILKNAGKFLCLVIKSIKFKRFDLKIWVGGDDASKVAVNYGEICSVFYPFCRVFVDLNEPKSYNLSVAPDFVSSKIKVDMDISFKARIFSFLIILINIIKIMRSDLK